MKSWKYAVLGIGAALVLAVVWGFVRPQNSIAPTVNQNSNQAVSNSNAGVNTNSDSTAQFSTADLPDRDGHLNFQAQIPAGWAAEYIPGSKAINFYDPKAAGDSTLDKSQIFVKYFEAPTFLTLDTVDIKSRTETTISGHPAVTYVIVKKSGVSDFSDQPSWRNEEHHVTDIRSADASPTVFYVFAKAPALSDTIFDAVLQSVSFGNVEVSTVVYPLTNFPSRVTKKPFGIHITPSTSPIQPERFSGWHSGADGEVTDTERGQDVPVYAIAAGTIRLVRSADGYGGVLIIEHTVGQETVSALYGHIRLSSVKKVVGDTVARADQVAVLGIGGTAETDGERQHLHFSLRPGSSTNLRGYAASEADLRSWINPLTWLADHDAAAPVPT